MRQTLIQGLLRSEQALPDGAVDALCRYGQLLLEKNQVMNLTRITDPAEVARLHFLDSLSLLKLADFRGRRVIDVGTGCGVPGIPLLLAEPSMDLTLLDSLAKRMDWLREILPQLGAEAEVVTARAEDFVAGRREAYDICVSRAVARLPVLCELCLPYVKPGGLFLAMKGELADQEAREAERAIGLLGGRIREIADCPLGDVTHRVVVVEKLRPTPAQYPRPFAKIKKTPL